MRRVSAAIAITFALIGPSFAQKAEIQKANAKWI